MRFMPEVVVNRKNIHVKRILSQFTTNSRKLVTTEWNARVTIKDGVDLSRSYMLTRMVPVDTCIPKQPPPRSHGQLGALEQNSQ
jgi:hypothetical protein